MKKLIVIALILTLSIGPKIIMADMSSTVNYLQNQTKNDWVAQAIFAAGEQNVDLSFVDTDADDLMTAAKHLLTLTASGSENQSDLNNLADTIKSAYNNGQLGSESLLNDDFWGMMALSSINDKTYQNDIKNFILSHQNADGGWSWSPGQESDTNDTSAAIMALLDTELNSQSTEIQAALDYLKNNQNDDGGFPYGSDSESDGASTAWVLAALNKSGIDENTWQKNNNSPVDFLASLEQTDGSYLWLPGDETSSSMVTAYVAVALTGNSYPINYVELEEAENNNNQSGVNVRIEGPDNTICLVSELLIGNVLEVLTEATDICNIDFVVTDTAYGPYVSSIGNIDAEGMEGWQYFVNYESGMLSVTDYNLADGDELLWAYGGFPFYASQLEINKNMVVANEEFIATVRYFDGNQWQAVYNKDIYVGSDTYSTDINGQVSISMEDDGVYPVFLQQNDEYVRSNKKYITVGNGISKSVDLKVNVESQGDSEEDTIAFSVSQSSIDFGNLKPGQSAETSFSLSNAGNVDIYVEANIDGSEVWQDYTTLNQSNWLDFSEHLSEDENLPISLRLSLPQSLDTRGQQNGQLIFWATAR